MGCGGSKDDADAPGTISSPTFVTSLPSGELCIACKQSLNVITSGGEPVRQIPKMDAPRGIVAMGDVLFVSELNTHCVRKLKLGDGSQLASFGSKGAGDGELQFPGCVRACSHTHTHHTYYRNQRYVTASCVRSTHPSPGLPRLARGLACMGDTLYVADWGNKRVVALSMDLTFKFSFRKGADAMEPCGIAASDKELFVSDQAAHQLHVFSPTGDFLRSIGANGTQPGQFKSPCGVTYIGGILFVAEYVGRRVQALETDGTPLQVCSSSLGPLASAPRGGRYASASLPRLSVAATPQRRCHASASLPRLRPGAARGGRDLALRSVRRKATAPHRGLHAIRHRRAARSLKYHRSA